MNNPITSPSVLLFLNKALGALVNILLPFLVISYVIVGFMFISACGNSEKLKVAKMALFYTFLGTLLVLGAWGLAKMISTTIQSVQI